MIYINRLNRIVKLRTHNAVIKASSSRIYHEMLRVVVKPHLSLWQSPVLPVMTYDGVIKWKHFPLYWPFVRGIHRSPVNSPHKGQWRGALMFFLICVWINGWVNNREAGYLRCYRTHYDVTVIHSQFTVFSDMNAFKQHLVLDYLSKLSPLLNC